jgi:hypothetical protein
MRNQVLSKNGGQPLRTFVRVLTSRCWPAAHADETYQAHMGFQMKSHDSLTHRVLGRASNLRELAQPQARLRKGGGEVEADIPLPDAVAGGFKRSRGRPPRAGSFKRIEAEIAEPDYAKLDQLKLWLEKPTIVETIRYSLNILYFLVQQQMAGKEIYIVSRDNPKEKTRVVVWREKPHDFLVDAPDLQNGSLKRKSMNTRGEK